ncbi:reverse transcriptase [Cucumis melo var. makuwa]|uniref:Reverse transcriptase n=1 Tax=Cucumis melo var. makuwa TaxID=1194695 RepID=A0A5A7TVP7_CUCMM|nr:reverse transcriptase [Cucumis melo var. makuwa]TYK18980.1 reverse transcriptase [Cucumis melo var. makuwa]
MMEGPLLGIADVTKPFEVETDASNYALEGVLLQNGHLIAYESRKLNATEMRYTVSEKEMLVVVHCLRAWRQYLLGDFEAILVIIDRFSKYATFIPTTKQCSAEMTAQLFFKHVVKLWGVPTSITERFNYMLEEYLRHFVNARQKNWVQLLDIAQFCFNGQASSSIGRSPFEIVSGRQPVLPHLVDHPFAGKNPQVLNFTKEWKQTNDIDRVYLEKALKWMKKWADKKRRPLEFRAED